MNTLYVSLKSDRNRFRQISSFCYIH